MSDSDHEWMEQFASLKKKIDSLAATIERYVELHVDFARRIDALEKAVHVVDKRIGSFSRGEARISFDNGQQQSGSAGDDGAVSSEKEYRLDGGTKEEDVGEL